MAGFTAAGFAYLITRHEMMGHLIGLVALPTTHPLYGVHYHNLADISVHGGLSFSGPREDHCHAFLELVRQSAWWVGFHCAHAGDRCPIILGSGVYRDMAFVKAEVDSLANQLADRASVNVGPSR